MEFFNFRKKDSIFLIKMVLFHYLYQQGCFEIQSLDAVSHTVSSGYSSERPCR